MDMLNSLSSSSSSSSSRSHPGTRWINNEKWCYAKYKWLIDDCGKLCRFAPHLLHYYCLVHNGRWLWNIKYGKCVVVALAIITINDDSSSIIIDVAIAIINHFGLHCQWKEKKKNKIERIEQLESILTNLILGGSFSKNLAWIGINLRSSVWKLRMLPTNPSPLIAMDKSVQFDVRDFRSHSPRLLHCMFSSLSRTTTIKNQWNDIKMVSSMQ